MESNDTKILSSIYIFLLKIPSKGKNNAYNITIPGVYAR